MKKIAVYLASIISKILSRSYYITQLARDIVRRYDNDCNADIKTNGEKALIQRIVKLTDIDSVIVDVGANVGDYSSLIVKEGYRGKLFIVDPLEKNIKQIKEMLQNVSNLIFCQFALSDDVKKAKLFVNEDQVLSGHDSLFDMRAIGYSDKVSSRYVDVTTLDKLMADYEIGKIDFVKIDVEGNEYAVLKGCNTLLSSGSIDFIQIEFGHAARAARVYLYDIVNFMRSLSYELYVIKPGGLMRLDSNPFMENRYSYINILLVKKGEINRLEMKIYSR